MRKPRARSRILKKLPRAPGGNCAQEGACPRHDRNLVRRRGPHRPEEQDHPPLGQARHPSKRTAGPTDRFHLHLRCSLPEGGQGCSPDHAGLQHRGDELAPRRDRRNRCARCPRHPPGRSSRLALVHAPPRAGQYHHHSAAAEVPRAQPGRERLAVHARQLALQPHLQILRRSRRPLLCGMEQARRSALAHHVQRTAPMGPRVLINGIWYKTGWSAFLKHLKERGLKGVRLITSDACIGLAESAAEFFLEAAWQRCVVHWYRNIFSHVPSTKVREIAAMLKAIHASEDLAAAREKAIRVIEKLRGLRLSRAAELVEAAVEETLTYYAFPEEHWRRIRTNNPLERILREIRRRTRVVGAFPDGQSALNLAAARLRHIAGTAWSTKRYLNIELLKDQQMRGAITA